MWSGIREIQSIPASSGKRYDGEREEYLHARRTLEFSDDAGLNDSLRGLERLFLNANPTLPDFSQPFWESRIFERVRDLASHESDDEQLIAMLTDILYRHEDEGELHVADWAREFLDFFEKGYVTRYLRRAAESLESAG